jgi:hypothetical protein
MREEYAALQCLADCGAVVGGDRRFHPLVVSKAVETFTTTGGRRGYRLTQLGRELYDAYRQKQKAREGWL